MMPQEPDQRSFTRVPSLLEVDVVLEHGTTVRGRIRDLSLRGLFLPASVSAAVGTPCRALLYPAGREHGFFLETRGVVARCDETGVGVRFDEMVYDAFEKLRSLLSIRSTDKERIDAEIEAELGLLD